jgi:hypothetical protein
MSTLETNSIGKYSGNNVSIDDALNLKSYTTAQRDALTSVAGDMIYNSDDNKPQIYNGTAWEGFGSSNVFEVDYLVVAGGASGLAGVGGGGGGGGVIENTGTSLVKGVSYFVSVGAGGATVNGNAYSGNIGNNSQFLSIAGGGGYGGGQNSTATQPPTHQGSGGGGGGGTNTPTNQTAGSAGNYGNANAGGTGVSFGSGGGGGGASAAGVNASGTVAGDGGEGLTSSITGTSEVYGSGGGGGTSSTTSSNAGTGGTNAGDGGYNTNSNNSVGINGTAGTANKGGGGGGSGGSLAPSFFYGYGEAGGSGVVIVRWATADATIGATRTGLTDAGVQANGSNSYIVFTAGTGNITFS